MYCTDGCDPSCGCWELKSGSLLAPHPNTLPPPVCSSPKICLSLYVSTPSLSSDTPGEGVRSHYSCNQPPCGSWDLNSGPSEEQSVLLTAEPSLQPERYLSSPYAPWGLTHLHQSQLYPAAQVRCRARSVGDGHGWFSGLDPRASFPVC